jgi:hypothetical protein
LLQEPLNVISGPKAFNSGKPTADNSFLYTFDEPGSYTVASQGAPGYSCIVFVLAAGMLTFRLIDWLIECIILYHIMISLPDILFWQGLLSCLRQYET